MNTWAIVLAAGRSIRFGSDKRLYPVAGQPMLQRAVAVVRPAVGAVLVVLRADDQGARESLLGCFAQDARVQPLWLPDPERGLGANLARAVAVLPPACDGVLVMLADLPYVQPATVQAVIDHAEPARIVVPVCPVEGGSWQRGHPVWFARHFFPALQTLAGDRGARDVLAQHPDAVVECRVPDSGITRDIDTHPASGSHGD